MSFDLTNNLIDEPKQLIDKLEKQMLQLKIKESKS